MFLEKSSDTWAEVIYLYSRSMFNTHLPKSIIKQASKYLPTKEKRGYLFSFVIGNERRI